MSRDHFWLTEKQFARIAPHLEDRPRRLVRLDQLFLERFGVAHHAPELEEPEGAAAFPDPPCEKQTHPPCM